MNQNETTALLAGIFMCLYSITYILIFGPIMFYLGFMSTLNLTFRLIVMSGIAFYIIYKLKKMGDFIKKIGETK